jgi:hypothetical protein
LPSACRAQPHFTAFIVKHHLIPIRKNLDPV